jgi:hypothetical protein
MGLLYPLVTVCSQGYSVGRGLGRQWGGGLVLDLEPFGGGRLPACFQ